MLWRMHIVTLVVAAAGFLRKGRNYMRLFYWGRRVRGWCCIDVSEMGGEVMGGGV